MKTYRIENSVSGVLLGDYQGETPEDAINAMLRDAGYPDPEDAPGDSGDLSVYEVNPEDPWVQS